MSKKTGKKLNDFSSLGGLVFSTNRDLPLEEAEEENDLQPDEQSLAVWFEKKGRAGKKATIVRGFEGSESSLNALAKQLKGHLGTGGSAKDGEIIIQGNFQEKVYQILVKQGYKCKKVGG